MKLRPIEAFCRVTNKAALNGQRQEYHPFVEMRPTASLKPSERNARTHSKKQVRQIANSLKAFKLIVPLLVDENDVVIAGHGRLEAAKLLGLAKVPVIAVMHLTDAEKEALAFADNKIAANAGWDRAKVAAGLSALIVPLSELELDITITGFDTPEIDALAADFADPESDPADAVPELSKRSPTTATGDLWYLGDHRLYCGDTSDERSFFSLMGGSHAGMLFTDPPYNLRIRDIIGRGATSTANSSLDRVKCPTRNSPRSQEDGCHPPLGSVQTAPWPTSAWIGVTSLRSSLWAMRSFPS